VRLLAKKGDEQVIFDISGDYTNLDKSLDGATQTIEKKSSTWESKLLGATKGVGIAAAGMVSLVGGAAAGVGISAVNSAVSMDQAMNQFIVSTGKGKEATEEYQQVLENIYKGNYGEDFEDIAQSMAAVDQMIGNMGGGSEGLEIVTKQAITLRDTFGYEVTESVRAAAAMMNHFGIDGDKAMSLIAVSAQNGLDFSGELLDSISEYSVQFAKVGLDADDMFKIMQQGAETGAWNLDKVGDAIKEMSIRVIDGSDTTKAGFAAIGLDADEMAKKFAAGGESAKGAFQQTITALAKMKDPLTQNIAGVNLFGTMWEDLGPDVVTQLANIEDGTYATADAMEEMQGMKYDDLDSMFKGLQRSVELLLIPLGESLIPMLSKIIDAIMPVLESILPIITENFNQLLTPLLSMIEEIMPTLIVAWEQIIPPLMDLINAILPVLIDLFNTIVPVLYDLLSAILPPLIEVFTMLIDPLMQLIDQLLPPLIELFRDILMPAIQLLMPVISLLANIFTSVLGGAINAVMPIVKGVIDVFRGIIDFITGVFTGNWEQAWNGIVNAFKAIINLIPGFFEAVINSIIGVINGITGGLSNIWSWTGLPSIPKISNVTLPRFKAGIDFVPNDFFPAFLDEGERVLTREENRKFNSLGGLTGLEQNLSGSFSHAKLNPIPIYITVENPISLDGREITRSVTKHQYADTAARRYK